MCSTELRELECQLKAAYMNKERLAQIAEKEAEKSGYLARDVEQERIVAEQRRHAEEAMKQREAERVLANQRYYESLQRQLDVRCKRTAVINNTTRCSCLRYFKTVWISQPVNLCDFECKFIICIYFFVVSKLTYSSSTVVAGFRYLN